MHIFSLTEHLNSPYISKLKPFLSSSFEHFQIKTCVKKRLKVCSVATIILLYKFTKILCQKNRSIFKMIHLLPTKTSRSTCKIYQHIIYIGQHKDNFRMRLNS